MTRITVNAIGDYEFEGKKYTKAKELRNVIAGFDVEDVLNERERLYRSYSSTGFTGILSDGTIEHLEIPATLINGQVEPQILACEIKLRKLKDIPEIKVCNTLSIAEAAKERGRSTEFYLRAIAKM